MKMKLGAVAFVAVALLSGCDIMFTNVFEKLALLKVPSASELSTLSIDEIQRLAEDPDFFDQLADDPAKQSAVLANLAGKYSDGTADTPEEQKAAALYAEIQLKTSGAFDLVNDAVSLLLSDTMDELENASEDDVPGLVADLIQDLFGEEEPTPSEIQEMLDSLVEAWHAYEAIGLGLSGGASLDPSLSAGDMVYFAALGAVVEGISVTAGGTLTSFVSAALQGDVTGYTVDLTAPDVSDGSALDGLLTAAGIDADSLGL